jgi:hypothetical protein
MMDSIARGGTIFLLALAFTLGIVTRRLVKRIPPEGDPRRFLWAQVLLYVGTFVIIAATVVVRLWGRMVIR